MTKFYIDFYYAGFQRTADITKESNSYQLQYTIHFPSELAGILDLEWVEITYEYPVTHLNGMIIAPLAQINYSNPLFEEKEIIEIILEAIGEQEDGA